MPRALCHSKGRTQLVDCVRGRAERTMAGVVELRRTIGLLDSPPSRVAGALHSVLYCV